MENETTERVIGASIEVHRHLGPGLLESAYEECLCYEMNQREIRFQRQVATPLWYKGVQLESVYRIDLLVEECVVVEIKANELLLPVHSAQLLTYLKLSNKRVGLLINFNMPVLKDGIKRVVNGYKDSFSLRLPPRLSVSASKNPPLSKRNFS
ncbi:MAG: GxxExxY protein [Bryobacteraceae bacterium]